MQIEAIEIGDSAGLVGVVLEFADEGDLTIGQAFRVNGVLVYPELVKVDRLEDTGRVRATYSWEQPR